MKIPKKQYSVLVVDDERKICRLIKSFLCLSVYFDKVVTANNALQAIQKLQNQAFDLLITDHIMPGKSGAALIDHIRRSYKYQNMKIVLISGQLTQETILLAANRGVKHMVVKPFSRLKLLDTVYEALNLDKNPKTILYKNIVKKVANELDRDDQE